MISELQRTWKEAVVAQLYALSRNLSGGYEENQETSQDSRCPGRDTNRARPEHNPEAAQFESNCLVDAEDNI
jgi:hypothetical protein